MVQLMSDGRRERVCAKQGIIDHDFVCEDSAKHWGFHLYFAGEKPPRPTTNACRYDEGRMKTMLKMSSVSNNTDNGKTSDKADR